MADPGKTLVRWFEEVWNQGKLDIIEEIITPDSVFHDGCMTVQGPEHFRKYYASMRAAFSEVKITPQQLIVEGNMACLRWSADLTHTGEGFGFPATNKTVTVTGMSMGRYNEEGKMVEAWQNWDMMALIDQLREASPAALYLGV